MPTRVVLTSMLARLARPGQSPAGLAGLGREIGAGPGALPRALLHPAFQALLGQRPGKRAGGGELKRTVKRGGGNRGPH